MEIASEDKGTIASIEAIALLPTRWPQDEVRDLLAKIITSFSSQKSRIQALSALATRWTSFLKQSPNLMEFLQTKEGQALAAQAARARYTSASARKYLHEWSTYATAASPSNGVD